MEFVFIFYPEGRGSPVPAGGGGKFVQIRGNGTEYLVLSARELSVYHANIVERFCLQRSGINGSYNNKRDHYVIHDPDWTVAGGGIWQMDDKVLRLSGFSQAYGRFDPAGLRERMSKVEGMSGYTVIVG
jgi:hypothetical protein